MIHATITSWQVVQRQADGKCKDRVRRAKSLNSVFSMVAFWYIRTIVSSKMLVGRKDSRWAIPGLLESCARLRDRNVAGQESVCTWEARLTDVTQPVAVDVKKEDYQ